MKTILIATDFSANAAHSAEYGYQLAKQFKASVILCNAFAIPVEMPQANMVAWPVYEPDEIIKSCADDLKKLKEILEKSDFDGYHPPVTCLNVAGALQDAINDVVNHNDIELIVMGTHGASGLSGLILGNHSRGMIGNTSRPLLLIPPTTKVHPAKKIAFATDLENIANDLDAIYKLINYAKLLNAELLLHYVAEPKYHTAGLKKQLSETVEELSDRANYSLMDYRLVKSATVESGLKWLGEHEEIDMLAMVHRPHNFLEAMINGSHTQKIAARITIPLLIFPAKRT